MASSYKDVVFFARFSITMLNASRMALVNGKHVTNPFEFHEKRFGDVDICFVDLLDSNKRGLQSK